MTRLLIISFLCAICVNAVHSQSPGKLRRMSEQFLKDGEYLKAIEFYASLDSAELHQNPMADYYLGVIHFNSPIDRQKGIPYMERYLTSTDSSEVLLKGHGELYYFLGKLYHLDYRFDEAILEYTNFIKYINKDVSLPDKRKNFIIPIIEHEIKCCKYGKIALKNPRHAIIDNLGDKINSIFPEYASVVSDDENLLVFTAKRSDSEGGKKTPQGEYFEDIYYSELLKGSIFVRREEREDSLHGFYFNLITDFEYAETQKLGGHANSESHDGSIQFGKDGTHLYFYRDNNVWLLNMEDTSGTEPEKLGSYVNSDEYEPSVFFSYDGSLLFVVSDREGGFGGLDIYYSEKTGPNDWGPLKNMGPNINTQYDEDAPYLDPDETTFYFSTKGHSSMGEYDIFRSYRTDTSWSVPVNLGFPINTPAEDIYFTMTHRYNRGYYASSRLGGHGDMDLYRITFSDERDPVAELMGLVLEGDEMVPAHSTITMRTIDGEEIEAVTDTIQGEYFLLLGHGKTYEMNVVTDNFAPYFNEFRIPEQRDYYQLYQEIHHVYLYDNHNNIIGQMITVYNALEDAVAQVMLYDEEKRKIINEMQRNAGDRKIEIYGDVKFYLTQDSLWKIMAGDSTLKFNFPDNTNISFMATDSLNYYDKDSYIRFEENLEKVDIVVDENTTVEDLKDKTKELLLDSAGVNIIIYFEHADHDIGDKFKGKLKVLAEFFRQNGSLRLEIEGHTDDEGPVDYNQELSEKRAVAAYEYLIGLNINSGLMKHSGKGELEPIAKNRNEDGSFNEFGRAKNRRVEFHLKKSSE